MLVECWLGLAEVVEGELVGARENGLTGRSCLFYSRNVGTGYWCGRVTFVRLASQWGFHVEGRSMSVLEEAVLLFGVRTLRGGLCACPILTNSEPRWRCWCWAA